MGSAHELENTQISSSPQGRRMKKERAKSSGGFGVAGNNKMARIQSNKPQMQNRLKSNSPSKSMKGTGALN